MRKALVVFNREKLSVSWVEIDIDRDKSLIELYDSKVPVLCLVELGLAKQELCHYFFDEAAVLEAITLNLNHKSYP
ncbi:MAG: hypothetical protein ACI9V8_000625 [Urechidicola sp.]|jgi:hypothetical protein